MKTELNKNEIEIILKGLQYFISNAECSKDYKQEFKKTYENIINQI